MNPLICPMDGSGSSEITEDTLAMSNLRGFNNNVGSATNKASAIRDKMFWFKEDSEEYKELFRREQSIQRIQQSIIDSIKTGKSEQVPKCWYDNSKNIVFDQEYIDELLESNPNAKIPELDSDEQIESKLFNQKIVAEKKPYYFAYIYADVMNAIKKYKDNWKHNCLRYCGLTMDELINKQNKTEYEQSLIDSYHLNYPVNNSNSVMNRICHTFEDEFDRYFSRKDNKTSFNHSILKSDVEYTKKQYNAIAKIEKEYKDEVRDFFVKKRRKEIDEDSELARKRFIDGFKMKTIEIVENEKELCDIVIDMTYGKNKNHQFAWDICGDVIINNLLALNNNRIAYFEKDKDGVIDYCGETYTMKKMELEV